MKIGIIGAGHIGGTAALMYGSSLSCGGPSVRPRSRRRETPPLRAAPPHVSEVEYVTVLAKSCT